MSVKLSENEIQKIYDLGKRGREAWQSGDIKLAEELFQSAWDVLPSSKFECDYSQSISRGMTAFYRDTHQFEKANHWLDITRKAYGPEWNPSVEFLGATVYFEAGDLDQAFELFELLFKKYGKRPFEGEPSKYLDFYKKRAQGK